MELKCEFCKKDFSTFGNLNYHIKNNKKCLEIQKNHDTNMLIVSCEFCEKFFSNKTLKIHLQRCKIKKEKEINYIITEKDDIIEEMKKEKDDLIEEHKKEKDELIEEMKKEKDDLIEEHKKEILFLQNRILKLETENDIYKNDHDFVKNLASQPKTTNNNKIRVMNNFFDNPEKVKQLVDEKLTRDHICDGQKGVAQFAINFLLKDDEGNINYFCTDPSRSIFKFQNSEGETEKDVKAMKLTNMLLDAGIKHKTGTIAPTLWTKKDGTVDTDKFQIFSPSTNEIILMQADNSVFRNELACFTSV